MRTFLLPLLFALTVTVNAQQYLKPGFDGKEYNATMSMFIAMGDSIAHWEKTPAPVGFDKIYVSPELGLKNKWALWLRQDKKVAVISIRGTVNNMASWLENFYAATVPAKGSLQLNDSTIFNYKLAERDDATVHIGWTLGLAYLAPTIVQKIKEQYANGVKEFIIMGHSQGGALAFLTRSYLYYLQQQKELPADIYFKTYCSAAPKPGNLYYAYDFDFINRNGWAFTVVNAADWVPETPFSVQQVSDYNAVNPFVNVNDIFKKQKTFVRWYLKNSYNKMTKHTRKSYEKFEKYLGHTMYSQIKKILPQFKEPAYTKTSNYMRAGTSVVLMPDDAYNKLFPSKPKEIWTHHMPYAYYWLTKKYYQ